MRVRAGLVTAVYKKALLLSCDERTRSSGDIINLMSVDSTRLQDFCTYGLIAISGPFQVNLNHYDNRVGFLLTKLDHTCVCFSLQPLGMACIRRSRYNGVFGASEYDYCPSFEKNAREADEES